jgi:hypothetical protein
VSIITTHLDEFLQYSQAVLRRDATQHGACACEPLNMATPWKKKHE